MSISGRVFLVNDATHFFAALWAGAQPTQGFAPSTKSAFSVQIIAELFAPGAPIAPTTQVAGTVSTVDGSFTVPAFPAALKLENVRVILSLQGRPFYRTETFHPADLAKPLDIYLYQPNLTGVGVTAGQVSKLLSTAGLPSGASLSAKNAVIGVTGSQDGADIQFGVRVVPDTSHVLAAFVDLELASWNIHVGFPADVCTNADDILGQIRKNLQSADNSANQVVSTQIASALEAAGIGSTIVNAVVPKLSFQFNSLSTPAPHTWALANQSDGTIVLVPEITVGYPRFF